MESKFLKYLYNDKIRFAYVIKAIESKTKNFEYLVSEEDQMSFVALWHEDQIITLHGDQNWCQKYFDKYYGQYNFYDMDGDLISALYCESNDGEGAGYALESHLLMQYKGDREKRKSLGRAKEHHKTRAIRKAKTVKQTTRYQYLERDGRILGSVLIEDVSGHVFIISEMIIMKAFRRRGMAYAFIESLMDKAFEKQSQTCFILYVDKSNIPALNLYKKLGFERVDEFQNLVLNDD